uniref:Putative secreted protein n=1 Tax=Anopheles darlingi TaxID=43151 RepID=A0A2M4DMK1_ANODA
MLFIYVKRFTLLSPSLDPICVCVYMYLLWSHLAQPAEATDFIRDDPRPPSPASRRQTYVHDKTNHERHGSLVIDMVILF